MSIYLDHNATTPVRPEVADAMAAALRGLPGNPSSAHAPGRAARAAVEDARAEVARLVGASAEEIVFTSGGTEGNELAIRGLIRGQAAPSTLSPRRGARGSGSGRTWSPRASSTRRSRARSPPRASRSSYVAVGRRRPRSPPDALRAALRPDTVLVTLALANHELGNVYDIAALARVAHEAGALFHTDAVQAAGKIDVDVGALGVDALTLSAHKIHGPEGRGRGLPAPRGAVLAARRRAGTRSASVAPARRT